MIKNALLFVLGIIPILVFFFVFLKGYVIFSEKKVDYVNFVRKIEEIEKANDFTSLCDTYNRLLCEGN